MTTTTATAPAMPRAARRLPDRRTVLLGLLALSLVVLAVVAWRTLVQPWTGYGSAGDELKPVREADPRVLSGGDLTTFHAGFRPFSQPPYNIPRKLEGEFDFGDMLFDATFKTGPTPDPDRVRGGLGPLFNHSSCAGCHFRDGRAAPPRQAGDLMEGIFIRISVPDGKEAPDGKMGYMAPPGYDGQLKDRAAPGVPVEGIGRIEYTETPGTYPDGSTYSLRKPHYWIEKPAFGPIPDDVIIEARAAPPTFGGGLLEAIPEATLLAHARNQAMSGTDVRGRPNYVTDVTTGRTVIGRFSLKANQPSLLQQTAAALANDMGLTSPLFPDPKCTAAQPECAEAARRQPAGVHEVTMEMLVGIERYLQLLAVPARRDVNHPDVVRGEELFRKSQCVQCHVDKVQTGEHRIRRLANQTIHPYTDLLLHDMGEDLAGRPDFEARRRDWRTPPLWGIGLTKKVNGHTYFLHDGRARSFEEAILWHGGEAETARERFKRLNANERRQLLRFLESL